MKTQDRDRDRERKRKRDPPVNGGVPLDDGHAYAPATHLFRAAFVESVDEQTPCTTSQESSVPYNGP